MHRMAMFVQRLNLLSIVEPSQDQEEGDLMRLSEDGSYKENTMKLQIKNITRATPSTFTSEYCLSFFIIGMAKFHIIKADRLCSFVS